MAKSKNQYAASQWMRVQARRGSAVEKRYYRPGTWMNSKEAIALGLTPSLVDDLVFNGGKLVPQMEFQNIYLGSGADWDASDVANIDAASALAMRDKRLNNVVMQYFPGAKLTCDPRSSLLLNDPAPKSLNEPDVQAQVIALYDGGQIKKKDAGTTIFNLLLPPGSVLKLGSDTSLQGLGGYHGSVHFKRDGKRVTLYYSANVFSEFLSSSKENGIVAFQQPWKNVVATLYHEMNEFRTDPDVNDAITTGNDGFLGWMSGTGMEIGDQPIFEASSLSLVFKQVKTTNGKATVPVQFLYSNAVHGAEGPIAKPH